jgi:ribosomal protein S18 acetylase RimI-like enzyme
MTAREAQFTVELDVHLRFASKDDLPKLEWYGQYAHFRNLFRRAFREQQAGRRQMIIADCNDFPIGHIFIQFSHPDYTPADGEPRAYLYSLRVMEMFRGRGIGTRLIEEAELQIINRAHRWATIAVAKDNEGALRLYERLGYEVFREDSGEWSYIDHRGHTRFVHEPCWMLHKQLHLR